MESVPPGSSTPPFPVEVVTVSAKGLTLSLDARELFLSFADFPWFKHAALADILAVERPRAHYVSWPTLDIDLELASIEDPSQFPLVSTRALLPLRPVSPDERALLVDLAAWCEHHFDKPDGRWGQEAAAVLRSVTDTKKRDEAREGQGRRVDGRTGQDRAS